MPDVGPRERPGFGFQHVGERLNEERFDRVQLFRARALDLVDDVLPIDLFVDPLAGGKPAQQRGLLFGPEQDILLIKVVHGSPFWMPAPSKARVRVRGSIMALTLLRDARYALIRHRLEQKRRVERAALIGMPQWAHTRPARVSARLAVRAALMSW